MWTLLVAECPPLLKPHKINPEPGQHKQRGAVAIEFAAIFGLFFALVYGTIAFGLPAVARMGFQHYSVEASRVALQADPAYWNQPTTRDAIAEMIGDLIDDSWIQNWAKGCEDLPDEDSVAWENWIDLDPTGYAHWREETEQTPNRTPRYQVNVCLQANSSILLPPFEDAPWVRGYTITTF